MRYKHAETLFQVWLAKREKETTFRRTDHDQELLRMLFMAGWAANNADDQTTQADPDTAPVIAELERPGGLDGMRAAAMIRTLEAQRNRLREAIWPGLDKFVPTPERPQQDFHEAVVESLYVGQKFTEAVIDMAEKMGLSQPIERPDPAPPTENPVTLTEAVEAARGGPAPVPRTGFA